MRALASSAGQRTADDALRVLRYQLDRLLPTASQ
jgi:hypothetical protein